MLGVSVVAVSVASDAFAQETQLPPLTVEGAQAKKPTKKKAAAKKSSPSAAVSAPQPMQAPQTQATSAAVTEPSFVPYTVPAGVSVIDSSELNTFGQVRTDGVLRATPGTFTRESAGNPGTAVNIRGFEGQGRVNMMIDGVRQNIRFTGHEAAGFAYVDPMLLAGIDIQRGAVSGRGGAGALAGAANFRTLGVSDIIKDGQNAGVLSAVTWGSNGTGWSKMIGAGMRNSTAGVAAAISGSNRDNYKNGNGETVRFTDQDVVSGLAKAYAYLSPEARVDFGGVFYDNDFSAQSVNQNVTSRIANGLFHYAPADNNLVNFQAGIQYSNVEIEYLSAVNSAGNSSVGRTIEDRGIGFDLSNTSRFMLGQVKVASTYGYEYFRDEYTVANGNVNPGGTMTVGGAFSNTTFTYGIVDFIAGLRYDHYSVEGNGAYAGIENEDGRFDPKLTLAVNPFKGFQVYATYSGSMRAPTTNEMFFGGSHPGAGTTGFYRPNPALDAETQQGYELGFNYLQRDVINRGDVFGLKAAYYRMDVDNYIVTRMSTVPSTVYFFDNVPGTSLVEGVEVQADYDTGFAFAGLVYSYNNSTLPSQLTSSFGGSTYMPEHNLVLTGGLRFLDEALEVGARASIVSGADDPSATATAGRRAGYELVDLFANYNVWEGVTLGAMVTNVFDRTYTPVLGTAQSSACVSFTIPSTCPAEPQSGRGRTFILSARAQF
ncbi:TonB-dependent receptor [Hyphomicrobium sp. D-2]|uniref:TonB-dependent receptor domain-containing protein n=1 Tax=Hyphomicrobium sp. D-2 TaxID=3041621 RepID=UPI0024563F28|nr:TonB-dependent receptor [Hyphomicrobium sp. D-2]MDH4983562.1 TonB-dependent receptor [Hyphomicrobium sp. D-2]